MWRRAEDRGWCAQDSTNTLRRLGLALLAGMTAHGPVRVICNGAFRAAVGGVAGALTRCGGGSDDPIANEKVTGVPRP